MADNKDNGPASRPDSPNSTTPPKNFNSFGGRNRYSTKYPVGPDDNVNDRNLDKSNEFAQMADVRPPPKIAITADGHIARAEAAIKPDGNVSENSSENDDQSDRDAVSPRSNKNQSATGRVSWREQKLKQGQGQRDGSSRSKSRSRSRKRSQRRASVDVNNELLEGEMEGNKEGLRDDEGMDFPPPPPSFSAEADSHSAPQKAPANQASRPVQDPLPYRNHNPEQEQKQAQQQPDNEDKPKDEVSNREVNPDEKKEAKAEDKSRKAAAGEEKKAPTDDVQQSKFDENADLKERRARRKTPSAPATADTEKGPRWRKAGQSMEVDLNDDSESNTFTFVDAMYRAPRLVKWAAGGMTALMFSMLFVALQHRLFGKEFVGRKWMSILALSVVLLVLLTMVLSSVNPVRFVRKFRTDAARNQTEREQRKADLLKQF